VWWPLHDVLIKPESHKAMHHPDVGLLLFDYLTFPVHNTPDLTIVVHVPQNRETVQKLQQLLADWHDQSLVLPSHD
jgi:hypothetical protein